VLILVEGVPGAGKSSTARFLRDALEARQRPVRWWYEEEAGHPVYAFKDTDQLIAIQNDLRAGRFEPVIAAALAQWQRFADDIQCSGVTVILDGCLFGYLTWSLFPVEAPEDTIVKYVAEIERIIRPCDPVLIHLRPADLTASFRQIGVARGDGWIERFVARTADNPYARRRGLHGFDGTVAYWEAYQGLMDRLFDQIGFRKLAVTSGGSSWPTAQRAIADLFAIDPVPMDVAGADLERFVGRYAESSADGQQVCEVRLEDGGLVVTGLPGIWTHNRLVARTDGRFAVESMPFEVTFTTDATGAVRTMALTGPGLLFGTSATDRVFTRTEDGDGLCPGRLVAETGCCPVRLDGAND
jgi:hypothetical protein